MQRDQRDFAGLAQKWSAYTSNGVVEFTKQLLAHLPKSQTILFRGDSGFFNGKLFELLDRFGHGYLVKVKLKGLKELLFNQTWEAVPGKPGWEQCIFWYQCGNWKCARRFVAVRQERTDEKKGGNGQLFKVKEYDFFCYVSTEGLTCWQTHKSYGQRAICETWIEEAKNQMALCSGDKKLCRWEPSIIRTFLIRVAGKLRTGSNQLGLNTPANHLHPKQWEVWIAISLG